MVANMPRLPVRPQTIARAQAIKYLERRPAHCRLFSADSKPEQEDRGGDVGSTLKKRLWDRVFENDKPLADLRKELKGYEITIHKAIKGSEITTSNAIKDREVTTNKAISNLSTRMETGFAEVRAQFAEVRARFAKELKDYEIVIHKAIKGSEITTNNAIKDREVTTNKAISNLSTRMETGFAEVRTDSARLERKISFMQWQMGFVSSAVVAFLGFAGYAIKRAMDAQVATSAGSEPAEESKDASNGVKKK